ncbi:hypothetical protein K438DRAFT_1970350 [Mycena galopus ATCC 62051]|nr:hypothetical protein K438DRAFT_1970350 [Mycena galopus ATCC 62051]
MSSIPRLDYSTGILTTPFRDFRHIVPTSGLMSDELLSSGLYCTSIAFRPTLQPLTNSDYARTLAEPPNRTSHPSRVLCPLLVQLPAHPDVSVSHPVGTPESSVHLCSSPAFILSIPAIFEHSRPMLIMTYVLGDDPFLHTNFRSTPALVLDSILFWFLPGLINHHHPAFFPISYHPPAEHYSSAPRPSHSFIHTPSAIFRFISGYPDRSSANYRLITECHDFTNFNFRTIRIADGSPDQMYSTRICHFYTMESPTRLRIQ